MTQQQEEELVKTLFDRLHQNECYDLVDWYTKDGLNLYDFYNRRTRRRVTVRYDRVAGVLKPVPKLQ